MHSKYKTNLLGPSPEDGRDYLFANKAKKVTATLPDKLLLIEDDVKEENQGGYGSCAAQVAACIHSFHNKMEEGSWKRFSAAWTYGLRSDHIYDREEGLHEGMFPRDLMHIMLHIGSVFEEDLPYIDKNISDFDLFNDDRFKDLCKESVKYRIKEYSKVDHDIDLIKQALFLNGPMLIAVPVYNYGEEMWIQGDGETFQGGHAMTVIGYDKEGLIIRNSWGSDWNKDGTCKMKWQDIGIAWEFWTTVDEDFDPNNIRPIPKRSPRRDNPDYKPSWWDNSDNLFWALVLGIGVPLLLFLLYKL